MYGSCGREITAQRQRRSGEELSLAFDRHFGDGPVGCGRFGGARGRTQVPRIVDWYMDKKINIDDLITHALSLERINDGFDLMTRGESIRSVVVY